MNTVQKFEAKQLDALKENANIPDFSAGDTVRVNVKVKEGTRERVQAYEGVCIARAAAVWSSLPFVNFIWRRC